MKPRTPPKKLATIVVDPPIYVKYRNVMIGIVLAAVAARVYSSREESKVLPDRVEVPAAERERLQRETDEKQKAVEERRKTRGPSSEAAVAFVSPGASPGAAAAIAMSPENEAYRAEPMKVYAVVANGAFWRFKLKVGSTRAQLTKASAGLESACFGSGGPAPATCKTSITVDAPTRAALLDCAAAAPVAVGHDQIVRIVPSKRIALDLDKRTLAGVPDTPPAEIELVDVIWKTPATCAAASKAPPAPVAVQRLFALGRGAP